MGQKFEASVTVRGRRWAAAALCGAMVLAMPGGSAAQGGAGQASGDAGENELPTRCSRLLPFS